MARSYDHMQPRGVRVRWVEPDWRGNDRVVHFYPEHTRFCSRRCDYCNPRLRWSRSRENNQIRREIEEVLS